MEPEKWRDLAILAIVLGTFLDLLVVPWLGFLDAALLAAMIYIIVRRRRNARRAENAIGPRAKTR
jgi:ABC-type Fe3+-siderophore transport system permease subunit